MQEVSQNGITIKNGIIPPHDNNINYNKKEEGVKEKIT